MSCVQQENNKEFKNDQKNKATAQVQEQHEAKVIRPRFLRADQLSINALDEKLTTGKIAIKNLFQVDGKWILWTRGPLTKKEETQAVVKAVQFRTTAKSLESTFMIALRKHAAIRSTSPPVTKIKHK